MRRVAILYAALASLSCMQCVVPRGPAGVIETVSRPLNVARTSAEFTAAVLSRLMRAGALN
jgi:hypothetical protein